MSNNPSPETADEIGKRIGDRQDRMIDEENALRSLREENETPTAGQDGGVVVASFSDSSFTREDLQRLYSQEVEKSRALASQLAQAQGEIRELNLRAEINQRNSTLAMEEIARQATTAETSLAQAQEEVERLREAAQRPLHEALVEHERVIALQEKENDRLKAIVGRLEKRLPELFTFADWADERDRLRAENAELAAELDNVLKSARPSQKEHPFMYAAWLTARSYLERRAALAKRAPKPE